MSDRPENRDHSEELQAAWHGRLCGMLCGPDQEPDTALRRAQLLPGAPLGEDYLKQGLALARESLESEALDFSLQIPGDDVDLGRRVGALAAWCRGFLEGYALVGSADAGATLAADLSELLADLSRIAGELEESGLDFDAGDADEGDFYEISEYVRVAAMNLYLGRPNPGRGEASTD